MSIELEKHEVETLVGLIRRKIEKAEQKEIDEIQIVYLRDLKQILSKLEQSLK